MATGTMAFKLPDHGLDYSGSCQEPASRLMLAVLEEALLTFQRGLNSPLPEQRQRFHEVDTWVASIDTDWPFSFENICSTLNINPDYIRTGLRDLKRDAFQAQVRRRPAAIRRQTIQDRKAWRGRIGQ
jgi:hypothetical protein